MWALNYDSGRTELWEELRRQFGPGVTHYSHVIDDDSTGGSSGNGNGVPERGERIELPVTIKNNSTLTLSSVRAELWTNDPYITMIDEYEYYGNMAGGASASSSIDGDYDFDISPSAPLNRIVNFTLDIYEGIRQFKDNFDGGASSWTTACSLGSGVWTRGTPTNGPLSAHSNTQVFATNLSGTYPNSVDCTLTSSAFQIPTGPYAHLTFYHWYDIEWQYDVGYVELRHAAPVAGSCTGVTWSAWKKIYPVGGYPGRTIGSSSSNTYNIWAYMGQSNGWQKADFDISPFVPNCIQMRFRFETDGATVGEGWFIDSLLVNEGRGVSSDNFTITIQDATPPVFSNINISPDPAKYNDAVTVTFTVSEELLSNPSVTVSGRSANFVSKSGLNYTYSYVVLGESPEIDGSNPVQISGSDLAGNPNSANSFLTIDFDYDSDGMRDSWEAQNGLNPLVNDANEDPDDDGITNIIEFQNNLNPQVPNLGTINVSSTPSGAYVFIDGVETYAGVYKGLSGTGASPLVINNLRNQRQHIQVILPNYAVYHQFIDVNLGGTYTLNLPLKPYRPSTYSGYTQITSGGSPITSPGGSSFPVCVDWNNDGTLDLLIGNGDGTVAYYSNSSNLTLVLDYVGLLQSGGLPIDVGFNATPFVLDWDNDYKKDLLIGDSAGYISLFLNTGSDSTPSFGSGDRIQYNGTDLIVDAGYSAPWVVDYEPDGDKDLISANGNGTVEIYTNTGTDASPVFTTRDYLRDSSGEIITFTPRIRADLLDNRVLSTSMVSPPYWLGGGNNGGISSNIFGSQWVYTDTYPPGAGIFEPSSINIYNNDIVSAADFGENATPVYCDIDRDGLIDIIVGNLSGELYLLMGSHISGDIDNSKKIDGADLVLLNLSLGSAYGSPRFNPFADLDEDGDVDIDDRNILLTNFGRTY